MKKRRYDRRQLDYDHLMRIDPTLARMHDIAAGMGLDTATVRAWVRKDGSLTVRVVWRSRTRTAVMTTFNYVGRYLLDGVARSGAFELKLGRKGARQ